MPNIAGQSVAHESGVADGSATPQHEQAFDQHGCTVADVADNLQCSVCGNPMDPVIAAIGETTHPELRSPMARHDPQGNLPLIRWQGNLATCAEDRAERP